MDLGALRGAKAVQYHDILYKMFRDIAKAPLFHIEPGAPVLARSLREKWDSV